MKHQIPPYETPDKKLEPAFHVTRINTGNRPELPKKAIYDKVEFSNNLKLLKYLHANYGAKCNRNKTCSQRTVMNHENQPEKLL